MGGGAALSVVLCTHARPAYLRACLAGLAGQSRRGFELLVVDSASPPAEAKAIAEAAAAAEPAGSEPPSVPGAFRFS